MATLDTFGIEKNLPVNTLDALAAGSSVMVKHDDGAHVITASRLGGSTIDNRWLVYLLSASPENQALLERNPSARIRDGHLISSHTAQGNGHRSAINYAYRRALQKVYEPVPDMPGGIRDEESSMWFLDRRYHLIYSV